MSASAAQRHPADLPSAMASHVTRALARDPDPCPPSALVYPSSECPAAGLRPAGTPAACAPGSRHPGPAHAAAGAGPAARPWSSSPAWSSSRANMLRLPPVEVQRDGMSLRLAQVQGLLLPGLEGQQQIAARGQHPAELGEDPGQPFVGDVDRRYQARTLPSAPSGRSRASIEPTSKRSPGWDRWAAAIIPGDRSTPKTGTPSWLTWAVTRPGPHPMSATGPGQRRGPVPRTRPGRPGPMA